MNGLCLLLFLMKIITLMMFCGLYSSCIVQSRTRDSPGQEFAF